MTEEHDRSKRHHMATLVKHNKYCRRESDINDRIRKIKVTDGNERSKSLIKRPMRMTDGNDISICLKSVDTLFLHISAAGEPVSLISGSWRANLLHIPNPAAIQRLHFLRFPTFCSANRSPTISESAFFLDFRRFVLRTGVPEFLKVFF